MARVVFPCDQECWWIVKDHLAQLKQSCVQGDVDIHSLTQQLQLIVDINQGFPNADTLPWHETHFSGLVKYFRKPHHKSGVRHFLMDTFPAVVDLVLEVETYLPIEGIAINQQQKGETREISRRLCCSIVACAFLCLFPNEERGYRTKLNAINFNKFFVNLPIPSQNAKLQCFLHFFDRVAAEKSRLTGNITFTRQVIRREELPTLDTWLNCTSDLCQVVVQYEGLIEDAGCGTVEVDFANRYIGGGVLGRGRVQEEIRFTVCPELITALLFMEAMEENEAIIISGFEQFSQICGYAATLEFVGDFQDQAECDEKGNRKTTLCAIDAVSYRGNVRRGQEEVPDPRYTGRQYEDKWLLRDVNKAFIGFCTPFTVPNVEEGYYTPEDSPSISSENQCLSVINHYVDGLLTEALRAALPVASQALTAHDLTSSLSSNDVQSSSSYDPYIHRQSSMDHLEVNFRDWYQQYRRRSSNLSDLSSRRSSCDVASRRSSACSAKGYSSEFSSEFEEYFDNFQMQEPRYRYHTIKEEVGSSALIEFASCLAASLLREGAQEAVVRCPSPQNFEELPPEHKDVERPLPVRLASSSTVDNEGSENGEMSVMEQLIRNYVADMFDRMWPFGNEDKHDTSLTKEIRHRIVVGQKNNDRVSPDRQYVGLSLPDLSNSINDPVHFDNFEEATDSDSSCTESSRHTEYSIVEVDDEILLAVADRIVAVAFQEALLECKYMLNATKNRVCHSFSESSQSDHSIEAKDQSDSSLHDNISQSVGPYFNEASSISPAVKMAERMMSGLFSRTDSQPVPSCSVPQTKHSTVSINEEKNRAYQIDCDSYLNNVSIETPISDLHSNNRSDKNVNKKDNENGASVSTRQLEMYGRIADRLLGSLSDSLTDTSNVSAVSAICVSRNVSGAPNAAISSACDQQNISSQEGGTSQSITNRANAKSAVTEQLIDRSSGHISSASSPAVAVSETKKQTVDITRDKPDTGILSTSPQELVCRPKDPKYLMKKGHQNKNVHSSSSRLGSHSSKTSKYPIDSRSGNHSEPGQQSLNSSSSSGSAKLQSSSPDTSGSDNSAILGAVGGASLTTAQYAETLRPPSQSKMKPKPSHPFITGNKKNYDQFANSLSRDLLTNAFLQVQEHSEFVSYPRRSSEPMQISNGAALQRLEHTARGSIGLGGQKSKTDEDISQVDYDWNHSPRTSSGFRDPILSRFAEELMKVDVSVPPLQLLPDCVSISSSSQSVCSTMSSFRDPLLASFEEELISAKSSLAKTHMSWSKMKGLMCSSKQGVGGNSPASNPNNSTLSTTSSQGGNFCHVSQSYVGLGHSLSSTKSSGANMTVSISQDSDCSSISQRSSHHGNFHTMSEYAEAVSRRIICEALTAIYCSKADLEQDSPDRKFVTINLYCDLLACRILTDAVESAEMLCSDWLDQNKVVTWSDEMETVQQYTESQVDTEVQYRRTEREQSCSESNHSSGDYEDALDIPYQHLEQFADVLAAKVLINGVAISRREHTCKMRRQYGRPIATGNWGCGAFRGDPHLKALLQWMAVSYAGCPCMLFYTFQNQKMDKFHEVVELVLQRGWDVSKLMQVVRRYCMTTCDELRENGTATRDLFDVILQGEIFPGV